MCSITLQYVTVTPLQFPEGYRGGQLPGAYGTNFAQFRPQYRSELVLVLVSLMLLVLVPVLVLLLVLVLMIVLVLVELVLLFVLVPVLVQGVPLKSAPPKFSKCQT